MGDKIKLGKLVFWDDTFRRGGAYSGAEEVGRMVFAYLFWVGLTVLAAVALGRLKRWLLARVKKEAPRKSGCLILRKGNYFIGRAVQYGAKLFQCVHSNGFVAL